MQEVVTGTILARVVECPLDLNVGRGRRHVRDVLFALATSRVARLSTRTFSGSAVASSSSRRSQVAFVLRRSYVSGTLFLL